MEQAVYGEGKRAGQGYRGRAGNDELGFGHTIEISWDVQAEVSRRHVGMCLGLGTDVG